MTSARLPAAFGPYRVLSRLAGGAHGEVFVALHPPTRTRVAVKAVRSGSAEERASIAREIEALARVGDGRHPGIVRVLSHGVEEGRPWMAMEHVEGGTLRASPEDASAALATVGRLCQALAFVHGEGLVHRDVKPENVIVGAGGQPVLVDFGFATLRPRELWRDALDARGVALGTAAYLAPEAWRGDEVDARADLYAIGCIIHERLAGRPPFHAASAAAMRRAHLAEPAPDLDAPGVHPRIRRLVGSLLAKDPERRPGHAEDVVDELRRAGVRIPRAEGPRPRPRLLRPGLAGREQELARCAGALREAAAGRGGVLLLSGTGGAGKTRLALELAGLARASGAIVLTGGPDPAPMSEGAGGAPLSAWRGPLQQIALRCRDTGTPEGSGILGPRADVLAPFTPAFLTRALLAGEPARSTPVSSRRVFDAVAETLAALGAHRAVLVILDDVHRADAQSLALLDHVASTGALRATRVLVLATLRGDEATEPLLRMLARVSSVSLPPLPAEDVHRLAAGMLGTRRLPARLGVELARAGHGNPLYVAEHLRAALAAGAIRRGGVVSRRARLPFPSTIQGLIRTRLAALSPEARRLLQALAACGGARPASTLARIAPLDGSALREALGTLLRVELISEPSPGRYAVAHDHVRHVAHGLVPSSRRPALHGAIAAAIEDAGDPPSRVAAHRELAGDGAGAFDLYRRAAEQARAAHAHDDAASMLRAALRVCPPGRADGVSARIELGAVLAHAGRTALAEAALGRARRDAARLGDAGREAEALVGLARVKGLKGRHAESRRHCEEAVVLARRDPALRARALRVLAASLADEGDVAGCRRALREALGIARRRRDAPAEAAALELLAVYLVDGGRPREALRCHEAALRAYRACGDRVGEGLTLANLGSLRRYLGDLNDARALFEAALAVNGQVGDAESEGPTLANLGAVFLDLGQPSGARALFEAARDRFRRMGNRGLEGATLVQIASVDHLDGRPGDARARLQAAVALSVAARKRDWELAALCSLAQLEDARPERAAALWSRARAISRELGDRRIEAHCLRGLARIARVAAELRQARRLADGSLALLGEGSFLPELALSLCERAEVARASGADAGRFVRAARRAVARLSPPPPEVTAALASLASPRERRAAPPVGRIRRGGRAPGRRAARASAGARARSSAGARRGAPPRSG